MSIENEQDHESSGLEFITADVLQSLGKVFLLNSLFLLVNQISQGFPNI